MKEEVKVYAWTFVSFPLWLEPRPQFECLKYVDEVLGEGRVQRVQGGDGGERDGWRTWELVHAITETARMEIQDKLLEHFGKEASQGFRWKGIVTTVTVADTYTMGRYIQ